MERLTEVCWRNLDPWECCGQDNYCHRGTNDLGGCTGGCIVPKLYARLAAYEDTGLEPDGVKAVKLALTGQEIEKIKEFDWIPIERLRELAKAEKDNGPLTLNELRGMDGEPAYLDFYGERGEYVLLDVCGDDEDGYGGIYLTHRNGISSPASFAFECGGKLYRSKPGDGEK